MPTSWKSKFGHLAIAAARALWQTVRTLSALLLQATRLLVQHIAPAIWNWIRGTAWPGLRRFYLWLPHRRRVAAGLVASLAAAILVLAWLPGDGGTHSGTSTVDGHGTQPGEPIVLAVSLQRAPQGAPLTLTGLPEDVAGGLYVRIGGQPAPMRRQADGSLLVLVPLQPSMDGGWPVPPTSRQRIEVRRGDTVVAVGDTDIRILELPRAPGTTAGVL